MNSVPGTDLQLIWSPNHKDRFITLGPEQICLYKISEKVEESETGSHDQIVGDNVKFIITRLDIIKDIESPRCVSWQSCCYECFTNFFSPDHLLAIGRASGNVLLYSLTEVTSEEDQFSLNKKELSQRHRHCVYLAWNPWKKNLLAQGLEQRQRPARDARESVILIWDVSKTNVNFVDDIRTLKNSSAPDLGCVGGDRPVCEFGPAEVTNSFAWLSKSSFVTGMNGKQLRIYDLADVAKCANQTVTKAVNGLCVDPLCHQRLASFSERHVLIWNTLKFEKPTYTFTESRDIVKIAWSPIREGLLVVQFKDCCYLKLYYTKYAFNGSLEETDQYLIERVLKPCLNGKRLIMSFEWNQSYPEHIVTVDKDGNMDSIIIKDRISLCWSPDQKLVWSQGVDLHISGDSGRVPAAVSVLENDISSIMRQRALDRYGLGTQDILYSELLRNVPHLQPMWAWIEHVQNLFDTVSSAGKNQTDRPKCYGALSILSGVTSSIGEASSSDVISPIFWEGFDRQKLPFPQYRSEERSRVLQLCMWPSDKPEDFLKQILESYCIRREFEKAAALALFNLKFELAISYLRKGSSGMSRQFSLSESQMSGNQSGQASTIDLDLVALALAGYTASSSQWRATCRHTTQRLQHPYLRAIFTFLECEGDDFEQILNIKGISLMDRVGFACLYLSDNDLTNYIEKTTEQVIKEGSLEGVLLTGLISEEFADLVQTYLDKTGDVQTAAIVALQAAQMGASDFAKNPQVSAWIESYRELLNRWRLWYQRADFDINHQLPLNIVAQKTLTSTIASCQVFASCSYCGTRISHQTRASGQAINYARSRQASVPSMTMHGGGGKITICQNCRKPLPRCAICLMNMGTASGILHFSSAPPSGSGPGPMASRKHERLGLNENERAVPVSNWFVWCQSCKHGGHANHLTDWFASNRDCPVNGCKCHCNSLDSPLPTPAPTASTTLGSTGSRPSSAGPDHHRTLTAHLPPTVS